MERILLGEVYKHSEGTTLGNNVKSLQQKLHIKIRNVVASFSIAPVPLDLEKIHYAFRKESIWDKATFNYRVVVLRVEKPKMSFLIYQTGKVICTGARSIKDAENSADYFVNRLREASFDIKKTKEAKIQNILATADLGTEIDIEKFLGHINVVRGVHTIYEPEQFAAAIVKLPIAQDIEATMLLFHTGKVICVGLKNVKSIYMSLEFLASHLKKSL